MASEGLVLRRVWLALGRATSKLWRVNTGRAWLSNLGPRGVTRLEDGSVVIHAARSIALGFSDPKGDPFSGTHDLIGCTSVTVTP